MRILSLTVLLVIATLSVINAAEKDSLFLVNVATQYHYINEMFSYGLSLKNYSLPSSSSFLSPSWELGYFIGRNYHSLDILAFSLWGFLTPGISLEYNNNKFQGAVLGEVDFFYFPFVFFTIMIFEKPVIIPSVYFRIKAGIENIDHYFGARISVPLNL